MRAAQFGRNDLAKDLEWRRDFRFVNALMSPLSLGCSFDLNFVFNYDALHLMSDILSDGPKNHITNCLHELLTLTT